MCSVKTITQSVDIQSSLKSMKSTKTNKNKKEKKYQENPSKTKENQEKQRKSKKNWETKKPRKNIPTFLHSYIPTFLHSYIPIFLHSFITTFHHSIQLNLIDTEITQPLWRGRTDTQTQKQELWYLDRVPGSWDSVKVLIHSSSYSYKQYELFTQC